MTRRFITRPPEADFPINAWMLRRRAASGTLEFAAGAFRVRRNTRSHDMHGEFERGTAADGDLLERMMREFYREEHLVWAVSCAEALRGLLADDAAGWVYVVRVDGVAAGYFVLTFGYSLEYGGRTGLLDELFVLPAMRGRGLGKAAVTRVLEAARAAGCGVVMLEADVNNGRARELYRRAGFEKNSRDVFLRRL